MPQPATKRELIDKLPETVTITLTATKKILKGGSVGYHQSEKVDVDGKDGKKLRLQVGMNAIVPGSKKLPVQ